MKSVLETEVVVGRGLPEPMLVPREGRSRVAVLTQPAATTRAMEVAEALRSDGLITEVMGLPDRDQAKSLEVVASIYQAMASFGVGPHDLVVGVGGGSVTDVAGFVAATWLRGVEVAHFPTTLLGAIDASIGGKTAINVAGKNLVGVFWHPSRVVVDLDQLERLPSYLIREGLAEAFKAGLIGDAELARIVETNNSNLSEIVDRSITVKRTLVEQDPNDRGVRAYLNFGHTIGHAIEYSTPLSHGEAVSLGMVAACHISRDKVGFTESEAVRAALEGIGLPTKVEGLDPVRVLDLIRRDKKRDARGIRMVLLREIGQPVVEHVAETEIDSAVAALSR